jgi:predicted amidophosphoribosyltransferase
MEKASENTKRFWGMVLTSFLKYYPARLKVKDEEMEVARHKVLDFKDGREYEETAQMTAHYIIERFGNQASGIVFSCVPASTAVKYELRYKRFMERVSELCGVMNGYDHVRILEDRLAIHEHRKDEEKHIERVRVMDFDGDFFKGKDVICFDDVLTTGESWATYAQHLEQLGAHILGGIFLAKTTYKYAV